MENANYNFDGGGQEETAREKFRAAAMIRMSLLLSEYCQNIRILSECHCYCHNIVKILEYY